MEPDRESIGDEARPAGRPAFRVHGPFDPPKDLEGLEPRPEEACARPFHEPLEEALHA
jgi:hypothetical protein